MQMNTAAAGVSVTVPMNAKPPTPREKEVQRLFVLGKSPEMIAIRLGMKLSKVLVAIAMLPKPPL